jgi:hypothetical protein
VKNREVSRRKINLRETGYEDQIWIVLLSSC